MRFFMQYTTSNHKIRHAVAVELSKLYPGSVFAATISSNGNEIAEYLNLQKDIQYEFIDDHRDIQWGALKESSVDYELLQWFESTLPERSLWRYLAGDREWCYQFLQNTVILTRSYAHTLSNHDNILKIACGYIRYYKKVMEEFTPDVFVAASGQNNISCPVVDQLCRIYNVLSAAPDTIRTQNYMAITNNRQCTFDFVNHTYQRLVEGSLELDLSKGERIYDEIHKDLSSSQYFDTSHIDHLKSKWPLFSFLNRAVRSMGRYILLWIKQTSLRKDKRSLVKPVDTISNFFYGLYISVVRQYRRIQLMDNAFYGKFDRDSDYIYFPLHNTNEYSTQIQGTMWIDQLPLIEALAKSIPVGWKLIVKEHPGMVLHRIRHASFYNDVKRLPNVVLIPTETNTHDVISHSRMVVTIVGTTGWEAVMRGKPVLCLEENMFEALDLSRRCTDLKQFSVAIREELERNAGVSLQERRKRIICLLTAIEHCSFWADEPLKVLGEVDCVSDQERVEYARTISNSLKQYFEFHQIMPMNKQSKDAMALREA